MAELQRDFSERWEITYERSDGGYRAAHRERMDVSFSDEDPEELAGKLRMWEDRQRRQRGGA